MLRTLKTVSAIAAFATFAIAGSASADPISWSTNGSCAVGFTCNSSEMNFLGSDGTTVVTAKAWSYNGSTIQSANLGKWSGGLGVISAGESGSPQHTVDNSGNNDFVAFYFSETVDLTSVRLTTYGDTDISFWIGNVSGVPSFTGLDLNDLDVNYGAHVDNYGGNENRTAEFGAGAETGNLLVLAALVPANGWKDYFKIKTLYAESIVTPPTEPDAVSAPATLLVFGPALFGLAVLRRRNARKGAAVQKAAAEV